MLLSHKSLITEQGKQESRTLSRSAFLPFTHLLLFPIPQHVLRANIHALAAEDAVVALDAAGLHRGVDVNAHRALVVALFAVDASARRSLDPHLRQVQEPPHQHPGVEERAHPADAVAGASASQREVEHKNQPQYEIVHDVLNRLIHGDVFLCQAQRVDALDAAREHEPRNQHAKPHREDAVPHDPEPLCVGGLGVHRLRDLCNPARGTEPAAPRAPEENAGDEQHQKQDRAAGEHARERPVDGDIRREEVHRDRK